MAPKISNLVPVFCVETSDRVSARKLYINLKASHGVQGPEVDINEETLVRQICDPSPEIERYKIPLQLSQIYWSKSSDESGSDENYVIEVQINDKFAFRKVLPSEIIRHYLITVAMNAIEGKYHSDDTKKSTGQSIGHKLDLDPANYEIVKNCLEIERSTELVSNKVMVVSDKPAQLSKDSSTVTSDDGRKINYDLHFRPKSMFLTLSLSIDKMPEKLSFNDDRFRLEDGDKTIVDLALPINIDLNEPVKYKFDERLGFLRVVFKVIEPPLSRAIHAL